MSSITNRFWTEYFRYYDVLLRVLPYRALHARLGQCLDLKPGSLVLDAGAGTGNTALILRNRGWCWISLDLNRAGLGRLDRKMDDSRPVVADLRAPLPFPDACFDGVVSSNVLYDLAYEIRLPVLRELHRVLKPRGRIAIHNLLEDFDAFVVYREHLTRAIREHGLVVAVVEATRRTPIVCR